MPSNMFLDKIGKPSLYLPTCMIVWGLISGATGGVQNYGGLLACRYVAPLQTLLILQKLIFRQVYSWFR